MEVEREIPERSALELERDQLMGIMRQRSVDVCVQALEGLEVIEERAREGDLAAVGVMQRWARLVEHLEAMRRVHLPRRG